MLATLLAMGDENLDDKRFRDWITSLREIVAHGEDADQVAWAKKHLDLLPPERLKDYSKAFGEAAGRDMHRHRMRFLSIGGYRDDRDCVCDKRR